MLAGEAQPDILPCSFSLYERTQISPACAPTVRLRGRASLQIGRTLLAAPARGRQMSLHRCAAVSRLVHLSLRSAAVRRQETQEEVWKERKKEVAGGGRWGGRGGVGDEETNNQRFTCVWRPAACESDQVASE